VDHWSLDDPRHRRDARALADPGVQAEEALIEEELVRERRALLGQALARLGARERRVIEALQLTDEPVERALLAAELGLSADALCRLEARALASLLAAGEEATGYVLLHGQRIRVQHRASWSERAGPWSSSPSSLRTPPPRSRRPPTIRASETFSVK
jgi:hypothetical protein